MRFLSYILFFITIPINLNAQGWQETYSSALNAYVDSDYSNAIQEGEKALALASNGNEKLYTLKVLSATYSEIGNYKKGLEYGKQEVELCANESVPDSVLINSLNNLINNYLGLQDFANAIPKQREIVDLGKTVYPPDNLDHNQHISDLGYSYLMTDGYDSAIFFLKEANKYLLNIEGGAEDFLINQLNIGQAYYQKQEFISSMRTLQGLKEILENNGLESYQIYAEAMESLALVEYSIGKFAESQKNYEVASKKYLQLGFSVKDLEALNKQLALVYLKNELSVKSDSVQSLFSGEISSQNLIINQLSLAYKKYANQEIQEAKQLINNIIKKLQSTPEDDLLLAEAIILNAKIDLELGRNVDLDSINSAISIYSRLKKEGKKAEGLLIKGKLYKAIGQSEKAISSLQRADQIAKLVEDAHYLRYSIAVELLQTQLDLKRLTEAGTFYDQIVKDMVLDGTEYKNKLAYNYAIFLQVNGYNLEALDVLELLITTADYPQLLSYEQLMAKVYLDLGQTQESLSTYNEIEHYLSASGDMKSIAYGQNLIQLGRVNVVLGKYSAADGFYTNGIKIIEGNSDTPAEVFAATYNSYALFQQTIGNYDKTKLFYSKAKFFAKNNPALHVDIIQNLATLSQYQGQYNDAIILLKEALTDYESIYGTNHPYYATALQNLANAYNKNGDPLKARELLEEAIKIDVSNGLENSITYTNKLHNLAVILQETDDFTKAESVFNKVLANRKSLLGENHPDYIYSIYTMAVLKQRMKKNTEAKAYFDEAIDKYDFQIKSFFPYLSEEEKSKYYAKINEAFTAFQDFAAEYSAVDPSINSELYNFQLNHKAILLNASKSMHNTIIQSNDRELIDLYEQWVDMKRGLAKYYSMSKKELELADISINNIVEETNSLEKKLSLKSELFNINPEAKIISWRNVQSSLKENEAAIEIIRIKKNIRNDSIWYAALMVTPTTEIPKLIVFNNGKELESKFFKLYINSIKFRRTDKKSFANFWGPIHDELSTTTKVFLSCDGIYNKINISTLYNPETNDYVLDKLVVHNISNTIELTKNSNPINFDAHFNLALIGDPVFTKNGADNHEISSLPGTRMEIDLIDSLARSKNLNSLTLLGARASEDIIKKIESPNILHIATHGFFLADNSPSEDMYSMENNPLMRSGLLFSGSAKFFRGDHISFNSAQDTEDGILTAYEAMNMNLTNADLVILSACETGLGEVKNGEGVYGLQRAIEIAGAHSVLMSLWKVNDEVTKEMMVLFYQNIFNGVDKFEALNLAQKKIKENHNNPYYWGAFILSGI